MVGVSSGLVGWAAVGSQFAALRLDWGLVEWGQGWGSLGERRGILSIRTMDKFRM